MRMVRVFLRTAPMALLLVACATTPEPQQPPASAATHYELGRAYFDAGNYRLAIPEFSRAVELRPTDPIYRSDLGMAFMFNRNLDEAIKQFEEAIKLDKKYTAAKNNLASAYMLKGDLEKARILLTEVLNDPLYPTPHFAYFNLAKIYERQGKIDQAIEHYRLALDVERDYADAHNNLGFLYLQQGRTDLAISAFSEATRLGPKVPVYHRNLGIAYAEAGRRREARRAFERVLELESSGPSAEYARKALDDLKR
ncbi:MAG: tetratricopeptide repeat protein [Candidatus Methylomirabilales bacterium]